MRNIKRLISVFILLPFIWGMALPSSMAVEIVSLMPKPGVMLAPSEAYVPAVLKGMKVYPKEPLRFDFVLDAGQSAFRSEELSKETTKMVRYFLASLTMPENDVWVNLSPYEGDRIIPENFSLTEMGRDLLAQDYILKQLTASLLYPENDVGKSVWKRIYAAAAEKYGTTDIPLDTFNKVWIMPDEATVFVNGNIAYIKSSHLKVMLDADYLAANQNTTMGVGALHATPLQSDAAHELTRNIIREIVLPEIEKEVNTGKSFSGLRQIYHALVLAIWFKRNMKQSLVGKVYADQGKVKGIDLVEGGMKKEIWNQYVEAFKKGVFNYIKEEYDETSQETIPRKYFSGGFVSNAQAVHEVSVDNAQMIDAAQEVGERLLIASLKLNAVEQDSAAVMDIPDMPVVASDDVLSVIQDDRKASVKALMTLRNSRADLTPQIITALAQLFYYPQAQEQMALGLLEADAMIRSSLKMIHRSSPQHDLLVIKALAMIAKNGVGPAYRDLREMFKNDSISTEVTAGLLQGVTTNNSFNLYALGILVQDNPKILIGMNPGILATMIDVLMANRRDRSDFLGWKALELILKEALKNPLNEEISIEAMNELAMDGYDGAKAFLVENIRVFVKYIKMAQLVVEAEPLIESIVNYYETIVGLESFRRDKLINEFKIKFYAYVYELAVVADKKGVGLSKGLQRYSAWQSLNIVRPLAWSAEVRTHVFKNRWANRYNKPLALASSQGTAIVVYPKADYNGAFSDESVLKQLMDQGYNVLYYEVASVDEMLKAFQDATKNSKGDPEKRLSFVVIAGHGAPQLIDFGHKGDDDIVMDVRHSALFPGSLKQFVKASAKGVSFSCKTGSAVPGDKNMIRVLADAFGIPFAGPETNTSIFTINAETGIHEWVEGRNVIEMPTINNAVSVRLTVNNLEPNESTIKSIFEKFDLLLKEPGLTDRAQDVVGGIDLHSSQLNLTEAGGKIDFNGSFDPKAFSQSIDGFAPVVQSITPMKDPQAFLAPNR